MARVLAVGIASLDIVNSVSSYPAEDDKIRAVSQRLCRGGNATNTLAVLSQLGHTCHWAGVLADEPGAHHINVDLKKHHIDTSAVLRLPDGKVPTSYIIHSLANSSRTIVNYRDLPEYPYSQFLQLDLKPFDWLHFEGRNIADTRQMLIRAKQQAPTLPRSVEIEKERDDIESLFGLADVLIFSKTFAKGRGYKNATEFLTELQTQYANTKLICAWGETGAWSIVDGQCHHSPAFPPTRVIDTLAAGDTFNAGVINALSQGQPLVATVESACRLAGRKCGHQGLDFLNPGEYE